MWDKEVCIAVMNFACVWYGLECVCMWATEMWVSHPHVKYYIKPQSQTTTHFDLCVKSYALHWIPLSQQPFWQEIVVYYPFRSNRVKELLLSMMTHWKDSVTLIHLWIYSCVYLWCVMPIWLPWKKVHCISVLTAFWFSSGLCLTPSSHVLVSDAPTVMK